MELPKHTQKRPELKLRSINYDILLISETWLKNDDKFLLRNFDTVKKGRADRHEGDVALFIKNGIGYKVVENIYSAEGKLEVCAVEINLNYKPFIIISLYKPPNVVIS